MDSLSRIFPNILPHLHLASKNIYEPVEDANQYLWLTKKKTAIHNSVPTMAFLQNCKNTAKTRVLNGCSSAVQTTNSILNTSVWSTITSSIWHTVDCIPQQASHAWKKQYTIFSFNILDLVNFSTKILNFLAGFRWRL